jgi:hypothetical protein
MFPYATENFKIGQLELDLSKQSNAICEETSFDLLN